ncbi:MAG: hypothetical protein ACRDA8_09375, partial [Shewanella sp.]
MQNPLLSLKNAFLNRPKYQRVLGYLGATYVGYSISLGLIVPHSLVAFAPEKLSELLGRPVSLGEVRINPFTFDVNIADFAIQEPDGRPFVGLEHLQFKLEFWQSLIEGAAVIDTIQLQGPYAHISRSTQDGKAQFNFDDIVRTLSSETTEEPEAPATAATKPLRLVLGKLSLDKGRFHYDDQITAASMDYPDINIHLSNIDTAATLALLTGNVHGNNVAGNASSNATGNASSNATGNAADNVTANASSAQSQALPEVSSEKTALPEVSPENTTQTARAEHPAPFNHYAIELTDAHQANINLTGQFQLFPLKVAGDLQIAQF